MVAIMDELSSVAFMFESGKSYDSTGKVFRNRLNLAQRIDVLKRFQKTPDAGHLAELFQCSRKQIKNILRKRKKYLDMWAKKQNSAQPATPGKLTESLQQNAVGVVLNEWVQRARCYQINMTDDILRNFAREIAENLKVKDFNANATWMANFKKKFNIDLALKVKQEAGVKKPLGISVIIDELRRQLGTAAIPLAGEDEDNDIQMLYEDDEGESEADEVTVGHVAVSNTRSATQIEAKKPQHVKGAVPEKKTKNAVICAKQIGSYREALNRLGPLEQFALVKENVRAVGLINQLENLLREEMVRDELG